VRGVVTVVSVVSLVSGAGCGFQPSGLGTARDDAPPAGSDGPRDRDATVAGDDAKVFMDGQVVVGSLSVSSMTLGNANRDISAEGSIDWAHWGHLASNDFDHRANGGTAISDLAATPPVVFTGAPFTASWTGGTPHANVSMTSTGVGVHQGSAMTFTVAAATTTQVLRLYVGAQQATARLDLSLSDASAPPQTETFASAASTTNVCYTITFNAATAGATLNVSWSDTNDANSGGAFAARLEATLASY
jgi:hypothetical protein